MELDSLKNSKYKMFRFLNLAASCTCIGGLLADLADIDRCAGLLGHLLAIFFGNLLAFFSRNTHTFLLRNLKTRYFQSKII